MGCRVRAAGGGRRRATAAHAACRREIDYRLGAGRGEERTVNMWPMSVTLEVSKLSDWLNGDANCRESKGGHMVRDDVRPGRREAAGDRGARSVQWRARLQIGGRARGGAHEEHVVHVRDVGGVEAQRLVERQRVLPRVERRECGAGGGVRVGRREAASDHGARSMPERDRLKIEGRARGRSARRTSGTYL